jgi:hypothetical protein
MPVIAHIHVATIQTVDQLEVRGIPRVLLGEILHTLVATIQTLGPMFIITQVTRAAIIQMVTALVLMPATAHIHVATILIVAQQAAPDMHLVLHAEILPTHVAIIQTEDLPQRSVTIAVFEMVKLMLIVAKHHNLGTRAQLTIRPS